MVNSYLTNFITPERKGILAGVVLVLLVTLVSQGMFHAMYGVPEPTQELPELPTANGWDFSSGLHLSSNVLEYADQLVSYMITPGDSDNHFSELGMIWGTIQPEAYPTTYDFPLEDNDYNIGFHAQIDHLYYDDVHRTVTPDDLYLLNAGLAHLLADDDQFTSLTAEQYHSGIEQYFSDKPVNTGDELRIIHTYNDGAFFQFRVLDNKVFVIFGMVDSLSFEQQVGVTGISTIIDEDQSDFYSIAIDDLNLDAYEDHVNYLWYSMASGE